MEALVCIDVCVRDEDARASLLRWLPSVLPLGSKGDELFLAQGRPVASVTVRGDAAVVPFAAVSDLGPAVARGEAAGGRLLLPRETVDVGCVRVERCVMVDGAGVPVGLAQVCDRDARTPALDFVWVEYTSPDVGMTIGFLRAVFGWHLRPACGRAFLTPPDSPAMFASVAASTDADVHVYFSQLAGGGDATEATMARMAGAGGKVLGSAPLGELATIGQVRTPADAGGVRIGFIRFGQAAGGTDGQKRGGDDAGPAAGGKRRRM